MGNIILALLALAATIVIAWSSDKKNINEANDD
jgi:hypothetical protein